MDDAKLLDHLAMAKQAALLAGRYLKSRQQLKVMTSKGKDIKLAADLRSEKIIIDYLRKRSAISILSEESGVLNSPESKDPSYRWIIDPLDGSFNYIRNIPFCCVSIALWNANQPLLGVIHNFFTNEMFLGAVGHGARLNQAKINVSSVRVRKDAVLVTGFPVRMNGSQKELMQFIEHSQRFKKIRLMGSAALSLAYVAAGRVDSYEESGIRLWDVAAGLAIIKAAGGQFEMTPYKDRASDSYIVHASNGYLARGAA